MILVSSTSFRIGTENKPSRNERAMQELTHFVSCFDVQTGPLTPSHMHHLRNQMGAPCLTHGYFGPITSYMQVLRQECIYTNTPPP